MLRLSMVKSCSTRLSLRLGDPVTLKTGLTYPGGIIESLNSLYMVYPVIKKADNLVIPAADDYSYEYASTQQTTEENEES